MREKILSVFIAAMRIAIGWHFLYEGLWKIMQKDGWSCLAYIGTAQGPFASVFRWIAAESWLVAIGDWAVMLGLMVIGISLITGAYARIAAILGVAFLMIFFCCQPPAPFGEMSSGADGRFFLLDRNVTEAAGLLFVASVPCWRGYVRTLLPGMIALVVFCVMSVMEYRSGGFQKVEAVTSATTKTHEFTALAALKEPVTNKVSVGGIEISRLALDGELMSGRAHARDLIWTDEFMGRYNSGATLGRTVRYCLRCGIDTVFADSNLLAPMLSEARTAGGVLKFFAGCMNAKEAAAAASGGARGVYIRPKVADALAAEKDAARIKSLFADFKATGLPVGIGAEDVSTVKFCVENGVVPSFWVVAYHSLGYPAARMEKRCDNIWCLDPEATSKYMRTRKEPWIAVRGLAGGALNPVNAYRFARDGGAAVVAIDLLDYRIVETVNGITAAQLKMASDGKAAEK